MELTLSRTRFRWPKWKPWPWLKIGNGCIRLNIFLALWNFSTLYTKLPLLPQDQGYVWIVGNLASTAFLLSLNQLRPFLPHGCKRIGGSLCILEICLALSFLGFLGIYLHIPSAKSWTMLFIFLAGVGAGGSNALDHNHRPKS